MTNLITKSMVPSQKQSAQAIVNPRQFGPNDWSFDINRSQELNWQPGNAIQSDFNYFCLNEPHQDIKTSMFDTIPDGAPIYGHMNYYLNPLAQEQTNAHMAAYKFQKQTRVADNMNPFQTGLLAIPTRYPVNVPLNSYKGSMSRPRFN